MQVSTAAISCYSILVFSFMVPNDSIELCILSQRYGTVKAVTSFVGFIDFHPAKTHLEGGNCYAVK